MDALSFLIPLLVSFAVAAITTPLVARAAVSLGIVDHPSERSVSRRLNMPLLGGLSVAGGLAAGLLAGVFFAEDLAYSPRVGGLLLGGLLVIALGVLDDRRGLGAVPKLLVEVIAASIAIASGFRVEHLVDPITATSFSFPPWISWIGTTLWIVGITNAVNLVDGLDGLAAGVGAIIGGTLTVIAWQAGSPIGACVGLALLGALLGFLPYNFAPARIFLGDTGALFIGFVLALLALEGTRRLALLTFVVPLLALAVPILDTGLSILRRLRRHASPFQADRQHMHHHLLAARGSARSAVLQFYFVTACFCLIALSFTRIRGIVAALFLAVVIVLTLRLLWNLGVLSRGPGEPEPGELVAGAKEEKR
jgi:UDP-GlcNAc:undecaprenyl-phosphate/decaprenyl-phosphate GlcNAc-1-phosphate transferase